MNARPEFAAKARVSPSELSILKSDEMTPVVHRSATPIDSSSSGVSSATSAKRPVPVPGEPTVIEILTAAPSEESTQG